MKPQTIGVSVACAVAVGLALLWIATIRQHGTASSEASPQVSINQPSQSAATSGTSAKPAQISDTSKTGASVGVNDPQTLIHTPAPLTIPVRDGASKPGALIVTKRKFVHDVQAMTRIQDIAFKYGAPEKIVGTDSAVWRCVDGDVTVKAYNQPSQVLQNDGKWKEVDDFHIEVVSGSTGAQGHKDTH